MMVCSNTKTVPLLLLLNWLMMFLTSSVTCREELVTRDLINWSETTCSLLVLYSFGPSSTLRLELSIETSYLPVGKCTLLEMVFTITILKREVETVELTISEESSGHKFIENYIVPLHIWFVIIIL